MHPVALTIAGSDPSGGAGIQADLKTFHRFGVYGQAAITLLTVQNTMDIARVEVMDADLVREQIEAVLRDMAPNAAKTGALGNGEVICAVAEIAGEFSFPLVVDPVMMSKHGAALISASAVKELRTRLLPRASLITPNLAEAAELVGHAVATVQDMREAARELCDMGALAALVKGGHLRGQPVDVLCFEGSIYEFEALRVPTRHTHGTGCAFSAAITAMLANDRSILTAITMAKRFVTRAIDSNPGLGHGNGPLNHWA